MKKRNILFSLLLALAMILTCMPALAFAEPGRGSNDVMPLDVESYQLSYKGDGPYRLYSDGRITLYLDDEKAFQVEGVTQYKAFVGVPGDEGWPEIVGCSTLGVQNNTITIDGSKVAAAFQDDNMPGTIVAQIKGLNESGEPKMLATGFIEFRIARGPEYDMEQDRDILPGWEYFIDEEKDVWADSAEYPEHNGKYTVTGVTVTGGGDYLEEGDVEKEDGGWYFRIKEWPGTKAAPSAEDKVTFKVTYNPINGNIANLDDDETYCFTVNIKDTVYELNAGSDDGYWKGLLKSSKDLSADGVKYYIEKKGDRWEYEETREGFGYVWSVTNGGPGQIRVPDKNQQNKAVLNFGEEEGRVDVKVALNDGDKMEVAAWTDDFWAEDDFYQISPGKIENSDLPVGESLTITPIVQHLTYAEGSATTTPVEGAVVELDHYDSNALDISKEDGTFTITRKGNWHNDFGLKWTDPDNSDIHTDQQYWFDRVDYYPWKVVFDDDSEYEWAHFYSVDGDAATLSLGELNITVVDENGNKVDPGNYGLSLKRTWYDENENRDKEEDVQAPLGIHESDKGTFGYTEYVAVVTNGQGEDHRMMARGQFIIMDKYSLTFFCSDASFSNSTDQTG